MKRVLRDVVAGAMGAVATVGANVTSFTDSGLEGATEYIYEVVSFNDAGESTPVETSATTVAPAPVEPPLTPLSFLVARTGPLEISMGWVDRATNEDGYEVERSTDGVNFTRIAVLPANSDFYRDSGLKASTIYYYRARAFTGLLYSGYSARSHTKTEAVTLSTPGGFLVARTGPYQIDMAWTDRAINEQGYEIERSTDGVNFTRLAVLPANTEFYSDTGLKASTIYYYRARAFFGDSYSNYSRRSHTRTAP